MRSLAIISAIALLFVTASTPNVDAAKNNKNQNRDAIRSVERKISDIKKNMSKLEKDISGRMKQIKEDAPKKVNPVLEALKTAEVEEKKAKSEMLRRREVLQNAEADLKTVSSSLKTGVSSNSGYRSAEAELLKAENALGIVEDKLEKALSSDAAYVSAKKRAESAKIRVEVLNDRIKEGSASPRDLVQASNDSLIAESKLRRIKEDRFKSDEGYTKAQARLAKANEGMLAARAASTSAMKGKPQYTAALTNLETAKAAFVEANNALRVASSAKFKHAAQINRMKAEVRKFASDTDRLIGRRNQLKNELAKQERNKKNLSRRR